MGKNKEIIKSIVLFLLIILVFVLIRITWLYGFDYSTMPDDMPFSSFFENSSNKQNEVDIDETICTYPIKIAVQSSDEMMGVEYDKEAVSGVFESIIPIMTEALGNVKELSEVYDIKSELSKPLILLEYDSNISLDILSAWINIECENDIVPETFLIVEDNNNKYSIIIREQKTGKLYKGDTKVNNQVFNDLMNSFDLSLCKFAANSNMDNLLPETLIFYQNQEYAILSENNISFAEVSGQESKQSVLEAFNYNPYTAKSYYDEDGKSWVYVENDSTLNISDIGVISFDVSVKSGGIEAYKNQEVTNETEANVLKTKLTFDVLTNVYKSIGEGEFYISDIQYENNTETIYYSNSINGIPVQTKEGYTAKFVFSDNLLVSAKIILKQYENSEQKKYLLPIEQVSSSLQKSNTGIKIKYVSDENRNLQPEIKLFNY